MITGFFEMSIIGVALTHFVLIITLHQNYLQTNLLEIDHPSHFQNLLLLSELENNISGLVSKFLRLEILLQT